MLKGVTTAGSTLVLLDKVGCYWSFEDFLQVISAARVNSDQDGEPFFKYIGSTNPSANKDDVNDLADALEDLVDEFLITSDLSHYKFPCCTKIVVGRHIWDSLIGLDDERLDSMPLFYATDEIYLLAWRDVEQVFILINETKRHWSLAQFHIQSGNVTFYDSQKTYDPEFRPWYVKMRSSLEPKLPIVLQHTSVFSSKGIDPASYSIKLTNAQNVLKQGGVFGDWGVFVCLFLYM
nr:phospholipase-like protein [Tanacetum cinerariifolium]